MSRLMRSLKIGFCVFVLLAVCLLGAQQEQKFYSISVDQGLSQNSVSSIAQDKFGFIWFGTASGLNLYDGFNFRTFQFNPQDTLSLSESAITSLFTAKNGDLLAGTRHGGLNRLNTHTGKVTRFLSDPSNKKSLSSNSVNCVIETRNGLVLVGTDNGLNVSDGKGFISYSFNQNRRHGGDEDRIISLYEDKSGKVWMGAGNNSITLFDLKRKTFANFSDPFFTNKKYFVESIKEFAPGILMLATPLGIRFFDTYTKRYINCLLEYASADTILKHEITSFTKDKTGNVWCGIRLNKSEFLLAKINPQKKTIEFIKPSATKKYALLPEAVSALFTDASGLVWAGLDGKGICYFDPYPSGFFHLAKGEKTTNQLSNEYVYAIQEQNDGSVWIGTNDFQLHHYFPKTGEMKYYATGIINRNWCSDIEQSKTGKLWLAFRRNDEEGGVILFDEKKNAYQTLDELSGKNNVLGTYLVRVLREEGDLLWIGTQDAGLFCYNIRTKEIVRFSHRNGDEKTLANNEVADIYRDSRNRLWVATRGGLCLLNEKTKNFSKWTHHPANTKSLSNNNVLCVTEDQKKNLWICTAYGLNRYNETKDQFEMISTKDGLPDNFIYGALEDGKGRIWLSTNKGLSCMDPVSKKIKNYAASDGLQSREFNTHAWHKGSSGKMYFGGINGLNIFYPDSVKDKDFIPPVMITSFSVLGKNAELDSAIYAKKAITLNYKENFISFDFASLDYQHPEKNILACKLEGFDQNWIVLNNHHSISYSNLDPGEYALLVKGSNDDGVWNEAGTRLSIIILPPFYKTVWFYFLCGISVLLSIVVFHRYRIRKLLKTRSRLEQLIQERTNELTSQKNELNKSYDNVKLLSEIGKKITSTLDLNQLGNVIYGELNVLLDAGIVAVGILNEQTMSIDFFSAIQNGKSITKPSVSIKNENTYSTYCLREEKEIMINDTDTRVNFENPNTKNMLSGEKSKSFIYVPIYNAKGKAYGVLTAQSFEKNAYSEYHLALLRNLSVYINIAIENAKAYQTLFEARQELEKLSWVASKTDNGVVICDKNGDIEWLNEGFTRLYGYTLESFIDTYDRNIVKASNSSKITKILNDCFESKRTVFYESRATAKDGQSLWVQTTLTPILDHQNNIQKLIAIDSDITTLKKAEQQILQQKNEIEAKNKDITDSINYARRIQRATLATKSQMEETFTDHFVFFKPKDIVSGDFYWMAKGHNGKVFLAVADCTGHGVPGAILSVIGTALLDEVIVQQKTESPADVLGKMRTEIIRLLNPEGAEEETNDGIDIVLCAINFDEDQGKKISMEFACAKNPLVLIRNNSVREFLPDYFCVGKDEHYEKPFTLQKIEIQKGDRIYMYSDGFADQFGGEKGKKFKAKNLQDLLLQTSHLSMNEQLLALEDAHNKWKGAFAQVDDVCVLGIGF